MKPRISGYLRGIKAETSSNRITLSDSDFVYNSIVFRHGTSDSNEITVGAAIIGSCDFSLWNDAGKFDNWDWVNSAIEISLIFNDETVYMGSYVIVSHTKSGNTIKVEALDWLKVFDSHTLGECNITWPASAVSVINTIINTGVQNMLVSGLDAVTDITLADPADTEMTNRDALAYIAQTLGRFITSRSDEATKKTTLRFSWYNVEEAYSAGTTFSHNLRTDNINVTGVEVTATDGETTESRGDSSGYVLKISDNPFVSADNIAVVADNIASACVGLTFRPGNFVVLNNVRIEAGDVLNIDTHEESGVLTLATDVTYKPSQVKESVIANAEEAEGDLQISKSAYVKKVIRDELNNPNSALGSAVGGGVEMVHGTFELVKANISGVSGDVTMGGAYSIIRKRDESHFYYPTILHGVVKLEPLKNPQALQLVSTDYITISIPDLVSNSAGRIVPFQCYNSGMIAICDAVSSHDIVTRINDVYIYQESGRTFRIMFPDATINKVAGRVPRIYIPITLYA